jgi:hypothetical protein
MSAVELIAAGAPAGAEVDLGRNEVIQVIRKALKDRSGKPWSVTGGRGTSWGWITIQAPPSRRDGDGMTAADRAELASLLGIDHAHFQGVSVPASIAYRREYVARARGLDPVVAQPYWD